MSTDLSHSDANTSTARRVAVSDPHGYPTVLVSVLHEARLVDATGDWAGGNARLFVLGDFFDRGPDGVGVVDLLMRVQQQAAEAGGEVRALTGNHEALALGMHEFGPNGADQSRATAFAQSWQANGGRFTDQEGLTGAHLDWLLSLPAIILDDDVLLMHSDTLEYLAWGQTVEEINAGVRAALGGDSAADAWMCWQRLTDRYAFMGDTGADVARDLLATLGGRRIVHGHSVLPDLRQMDPADVTEPWLYAGGLVLAIDGGLYAGGPLLVVDLD